MQGIYLITNLVTGDRYIGLSQDIERRIRQHETRSSFYRKYGKGSFKWEVLKEVELPEDLPAWEKYYISKLHPEYNRGKGGEWYPRNHEVRYPFRFPDRTIEYLTLQEAEDYESRKIYLEQLDF